MLTVKVSCMHKLKKSLSDGSIVVCILLLVGSSSLTQYYSDQGMLPGQQHNSVESLLLGSYT